MAGFLFPLVDLDGYFLMPAVQGSTKLLQVIF